MYLSGKIEIDPSQITVYKKVKPTKLFAKFVDAITFGALSDKQEHETFTAVAILQQLNIGLRSINIKNVIRLAVDDYDFYLDEKGEEDDLEQAMFEFKSKVDPIESEFFNKIYLVLEHIDESLKYAIEIVVLRKHKIGEYPLIITVNAVANDFILKDKETPEMLKSRMSPVFASQEGYEAFVNVRKGLFDQFLDELIIAIKKFIKIDDIKKESCVSLIRPKEKVDNMQKINHDRYADPLFYGYYGWDSAFIYALMWSDLMWTHNLYCHDCYIVDSLGNDIMSVGNEGFYAGDYNTLNSELPFEAPSAGNIDYYSDNFYQEELLHANLIDSPSDDSSDSDSSDWLDSDSSGDDSASCNSCSSCGSCGSD